MEKKLNITKLKAISSLKTTLEVGKTILSSAVSISKHASATNVVKEGISLASTYINHQVDSQLHNGDVWTQLRACPYYLAPFILSLAEEHNKVFRLGNINEGKNLIVDIHGVQFKFTCNNHYIYYTADTPEEKVMMALGRLVLENAGSRCRYSSGGAAKPTGKEKMHQIFSAPEEEVLNSDRAKHIINRIEPYIEKNKNRSLFLYGTPGTGKTCLAENIAKHFEGVYLSFASEELDALTAEEFNFAVSLIKPRVLVMNDIDRIIKNDKSALLEILGEFNKTIPIIIATANTAKLPPAAIRCGRFDETIKVVSLGKETVKNMIKGCPDDTYEKVKEWPAAFIIELKERFEVHGPKNFSNEIKDLAKRVEYNMSTYKKGEEEEVDDKEELAYIV
jgi:adenylate kinase family enzyme